MDSDRLWALFFATGLPEIYLAIRDTQNAPEDKFPLYLTAFRPQEGTARLL